MQHHWLYSKELCDLDVFKTLPLPKKFCVLATDYDGARAGYMYADRGWMMVSNYALSPQLTAMPDMYEGCRRATMIVDKQENRSELEPDLFGFQDHFGKPQDNPKFENFCQVISKVDAYLYASIGEDNQGLFLIGRGENLITDFLKSDTVSGVEKQQREKMFSHRQTLWRALGPESGPDECSEAGCERLQTTGSKKCFLHGNIDAE